MITAATDRPPRRPPHESRPGAADRPARTRRRRRIARVLEVAVRGALHQRVAGQARQERAPAVRVRIGVTPVRCRAQYDSAGALTRAAACMPSPERSTGSSPIQPLTPGVRAVASSVASPPAEKPTSTVRAGTGPKRPARVSITIVGQRCCIGRRVDEERQIRHDDQRAALSEFAGQTAHAVPVAHESVGQHDGAARRAGRSVDIRLERTSRDAEIDEFGPVHRGR